MHFLKTLNDLFIDLGVEKVRTLFDQAVRALNNGGDGYPAELRAIRSELEVMTESAVGQYWAYVQMASSLAYRYGRKVAARERKRR